MTKRVLKIDKHCSAAVALLVLASIALPSQASISKETLTPPQGKDAEKRLVATVRDKEAQDRDPEGFAQAIERLGEMRSLAAIDDLINLITFKRPLESKEASSPIVIDMEHPLTPLSVYPATGALFHIGRPALPALMKLIEASDPVAIASENAVYVLMAIFREDQQAGVQYLQSAADQAQTREASKNLLRAVERARGLLR